MERFRVISDLHLDINYKYDLGIKKDNIFTVIAGDTSGEAFISTHKVPKCVDFEILDNLKFVEHFGKKNMELVFKYNPLYNEWTYKDQPIDISQSKEYMTIYVFDKSQLTDSSKIVVKIVDVEKWINTHIDSGILIAGNHIVYNRYGKTIEELKENLATKFTRKSKITFLDDATGIMCKEVDGILFIGTTLYTNYEYVPEILQDRYKNLSIEAIVDINQRIASPKFSGGGLNDFNFGHTRELRYVDTNDDESIKSYWLRPRNYLDFFNRSFTSLKTLVEKNKDKDIVVVTHHGISPKCISKNYVSSDLNASYISNLEDFIKSHKNIKCWCCGHVHHRANFKIGQCRVIMNPLGYCKYGQFLKNSESKIEWSYNTFVDTKTWKVSYEPFNIDGMKELYEEERQQRELAYKTYGSLFI